MLISVGVTNGDGISGLLQRGRGLAFAEARLSAPDRSLTGRVASIVTGDWGLAAVEKVRSEGDAAIVAEMRKWTDPDFTADRIKVDPADLAAADGGVITPGHIRSAIRRENQKMGRLINE